MKKPTPRQVANVLFAIPFLCAITVIIGGAFYINREATVIYLVVVALFLTLMYNVEKLWNKGDRW